MALNEFLDLSNHLKREKIFIQNERQVIKKLYNEVLQKSNATLRISWISNCQKSLLQDIILRNKILPCICMEVNNIESLLFVDASKKLGHFELKIGESIQKLKENSAQFAELAFACDNLMHSNLNNFISIVVANIFNSAITMQEEIGLSQLLISILEKQISKCKDFSKEYRRHNLVFSRFYESSCNLLHSCRIFLTAALHKPVLQVLMEDEWFYDMDISKAIHRFPIDERSRRFGTAGTEEYETKVKEYGERMAGKLIFITEQFILSIRNNLYSFPTFISSIILHLHHLLITSQVLSTEAESICLDMIVGEFICAAICNPELYGIASDAPISRIAQHNLIQVSQILRMLALGSINQYDHANFICSRFSENCLNFIIDGIINNSPSPKYFNNLGIEEPPLYINNAVLLSWQELTTLIEIIEIVHSDNMTDSELRKILSNLPSVHELRTCWRTASPYISPRHSPNLFEHKKKKTTIQDSKMLKISEEITGLNEVLIISLKHNIECPGLLPESKVMEQEPKHNKKVKYDVHSYKISTAEMAEGQVCEKRTRFSLSNDQESLPASDINIEAISEAASSHSVGSDVENDNLSDVMTSENVSGRATPSIISGRDTPISQAGSQLGEGTSTGVGNNIPSMNSFPHLPRNQLKTNRGDDVTDKFGKFEIRNEIENEAKSAVSDSWSTDVLESDSEQAEQNQLERLEEVAEENDNQIVEKCETASDAWSTDVLASDTSERQSERLLELDQDDISSLSGRSFGHGSELGDLSADDLNTNAANPFESASLSHQVLLRKKQRKNQHHSQSSSDLHRSPKKPLNNLKNSQLETNLSSAFSQPDLAIVPSDNSMCIKGDVVLPASMHTSSSASSLLIDFSETGGGDASLNAPPLEDAISVNTLIDLSVFESNFLDLKLTERQSIFLDERRFSEKSIGMFDPLMQEKPDMTLELSHPQQHIHIHPPDGLTNLTGSLIPRNISSNSSLSKSIHDSSCETDPFSLSSSYLSVEKTKSDADNVKKLEKKEKSGKGLISTFKDKLSRGGIFKNNNADDIGHHCQDIKYGLKDGESIEHNSKNNDNSDCNSNNEKVLDDILAKYRRVTTSESCDASSSHNSRSSFTKIIPIIQYDSNNLENCPAFVAAKTKLRLVFGNIESSQWSGHFCPTSRLNNLSKDSDLLCFLKMQLASAINLQDRDLIAQLQETIRSLQIFQPAELKKLLHVMHEEYRSRKLYVVYITRCHMMLTNSISQLDGLYAHVKRNKEIINTYLLSVFIRSFIDKNEKGLINFLNEFQKLKVSDEKADLVGSFLQQLYSYMMEDDAWKVATEKQKSVARKYIERYVFNHVYVNAIFPNGDVDINNDTIFQKHIQKLSKVVTPFHKDLCIPTVYHSEYPWPAAQTEIYMINAYKTPRDKLQCVLRCCRVIMQLLGLALETSQEGKVAAADDFLPVLIFILIKSNVPNLLSTVAYVHGFLGKTVGVEESGENQYWWMQFVTAIEFIKTMQYDE